MSLIADLVELYDDTLLAAAGNGPAEPTPTRVPYTAPGVAGGGSWSGGQSRTSQLELTTAESTLFSTLELIAKTTSRVKWDAHRKVKNVKPGQEPQIVTPEQNPAVALWNRPNNFMNGRFVRQLLTWHYRAVGEAWMVVDYYDAGRTLPRAWWPVRPDRMAPVPDPDDYLTGYVYTGPSGEKIPLDPWEVMRITNPHPLDPHRGIGVVQTLGTIIGTAMESAQWIANFFHNDATPGGVIEIPEGLGETDYKRLIKRWNEQHKGTSRAHRVAILEWGTFKPRSYSMKDMQFPEVRKLSRDQILEGFRIHQHNMGISEDVNRANSVAAREQLAENETKPNLDEWAELANGAFAERCGAAGALVEFSYVDPTPEDRDQNRLDDGAKVDNFVKLKSAGVDPGWAAEYVGMPAPTMVIEVEPDSGGEGDGGGDTGDKPAPDDDVSVLPAAEEDAAAKALAWAAIMQKTYLAVDGGVIISDEEARDLLISAGMPITAGPVPKDDEPAEQDPGPVPPPVTDPDDGDPAPEPPQEGAAVDDDPDAGLEGRAGTPRGQAPGRHPRNEVDLSQLGEDWQAAIDALLERWPGILDDQYSALARQVRDAIDDGDLDALVELVTPDAGASDTLTLAMVAVALTGALAVVREADEQGVDVGARTPEKTDLATQAKVITGLMRVQLAASAGQAAMRVVTAESTGADVAEQVREHLDSLTDAQPRQHLGGALTTAQNAGRFETMAAAVDNPAVPSPVFYASEQLDSATCTPCSKIDGRRYETLADAREDYPSSGYKKCAGLERCRGTVVAVWEDTEDGDEE